MTAPTTAGAIMTSPGRQHLVDTAQACYYAGDPAGRPACTLTATIRFCNVARCPSCNAARSSVGKGQTPVRLPPGPAFDVLAWIASPQAGRRRRRDPDRSLTRARQAGATWTAIGAQLGLTRQGAQERFTRATTPEPNKPASHAN